MTKYQYKQARDIIGLLDDLDVLQNAVSQNYRIVYADDRDYRQEFIISRVGETIQSDINVAINEVINKHREILEKELEKL